MKGIAPLARTAVAVLFAVGSCSALAPTSSSSSAVRQGTVVPDLDTFVSRRSAAFGIIGSVFLAAPGLAHAADEPTDAQKAAAEAAKERMRQRIADSKKNYRKTSDLVKDRKATTDYSCVAETGSPCPEPKKAE